MKRLAGIGLVVAAATSAAACTDFLKVDNPSSVSVDKLKDSANANLLVNGAIGSFQGMTATMALYGSVLSDESRSAHVNVSYGPLDKRTFSYLNDINASIYGTLQSSRYIADTTADRLKGYFGTAADSDPRVARMLAFAGYSYMTLGETFCSAPINLSKPNSPAELFQLALPKFDEAIKVAKAAKTAAVTAGAKATADSLLNLALVGAARVALDLGDKAKAQGYATQVPASGFEFRVYYAEGIPPQSGVPVNPYWNVMGSPEAVRVGYSTNQSGGFNYSASALWVVVDSAFVGIRDPRMPMTPGTVKAMDASQSYVANKPASFGGYVRDVTTKDSSGKVTPVGVPMTPGATIRIASSMEAQYILAEASGGDAATLLFVNGQRAANGDTTRVFDAATPAGILAELREQKRREFYLDGHRLGEIRRYKAQYGVDFFPTGSGYGTNECFLIPPTESNSNPNIPRS